MGNTLPAVHLQRMVHNLQWFVRNPILWDAGNLFLLGHQGAICMIESLHIIKGHLHHASPHLFQNLHPVGLLHLFQNLWLVGLHLFQTLDSVNPHPFQNLHQLPGKEVPVKRGLLSFLCFTVNSYMFTY